MLGLCRTLVPGVFYTVDMTEYFETREEYEARAVELCLLGFEISRDEERLPRGFSR